MRVLIIGAGHNGLVTAFYLAKAGLKPTVLERRDRVGGVAITDEIHPGFRCSTLAHWIAPIRPQIVRDMELERHGVRFTQPAVRVFAPGPDGRALALYDDPSRTARELEKQSALEARRYLEFHDTIARIGRVLNSVRSVTPPSIQSPSGGDLWSLAKLARRFRGLSRANQFRVLRWFPMAVADLVGEWFQDDLLRATIAARGIFGACAGPRSAFTGAHLLMHAAADGHGAGAATLTVGGLGALTAAMASAAREAGAEIRPHAEVTRILVANGRATGVALASGEEISGRAIVSAADPQRTFLSLVPSGELDPGFASKVRNYRVSGVVAKVNLALAALPKFTAAPADGAALLLSGRIHVGPAIDYLERAFDAAKYGAWSSEPYLDLTIPSVTDPSLAPPGAHVMSIHVQFAPFRLRHGTWSEHREALGDTVVRTLETYAPGISQLILQRQVITPADLESTYGLTGGHIFHGELAPDQFFAMRPILGWASYRTPIQNLYLCGSGTHPGDGVTGASGANASREILKDVRKRG
ncbi:MAG: NAD(P)/FAD-dependent oxidoreductase [Acidobacteria bacterium]|nr:NAD(P)/FAD-dependent oxidoreductase [Acidobacteriota bacterium]